MNSEKYIGLDIHQATIVVTVMDSTGKLVMESFLETEAATILQFFAGLRGTLSVTFLANSPSETPSFRPLAPAHCTHGPLSQNALTRLQRDHFSQPALHDRSDP
jgi:hypothetical protein